MSSGAATDGVTLFFPYPILRKIYRYTRGPLPSLPISLFLISVFPPVSPGAVRSPPEPSLMTAHASKLVVHGVLRLWISPNHDYRVILYGLECPLRSSNLDFVINRFFVKLFKTNNLETVTYCICRMQFKFYQPSTMKKEVMFLLENKNCAMTFFVHLQLT